VKGGGLYQRPGKAVPDSEGMRNELFGRSQKYGSISDISPCCGEADGTVTYIHSGVAPQVRQGCTCYNTQKPVLVSILKATAHTPL
jgi:hypothetical protein